MQKKTSLRRALALLWFLLLVTVGAVAAAVVLFLDARQPIAAISAALVLLALVLWPIRAPKDPRVARLFTELVLSQRQEEKRASPVLASILRDLSQLDQHAWQRVEQQFYPRRLPLLGLILRWQALAHLAVSFDESTPDAQDDVGLALSELGALHARGRIPSERAVFAGVVAVAALLFRNRLSRWQVWFLTKPFRHRLAHPLS